MLTHQDFLKTVAEEKRHTFVSTGMSAFEDIDLAVEIFRSYDCPFTLMHCVSTCPSKDEELNLLGILTLRDRYNCDIGYSGHEVGYLPAVLATLLGAAAVERHITLDRAMYGSDQAASLEKRGLEYLTRDIRNLSKMLGSGSKEISEKELDVAEKLRCFEN